MNLSVGDFPCIKTLKFLPLVNQNVTRRTLWIKVRIVHNLTLVNTAAKVM